MDIRPLADLQALDDRVRHFVPAGFSAEQAAEILQQTIADLDLDETVPEGLRASYERVRKLFVYGVLDYEFYTVAGEQARLILEQALRERFLIEHASGAPFVDRDGTVQVVTAATFDDLHEQVRRLNNERLNGRPRKWRLQLRHSAGTMYFDGMLATLTDWARREDLLHGQRNRHHEKLLARMRNRVAHAASYHLGMPNDAAVAIADVAEIINRLWGAPMPGGRLYPAPAQREIWAVAWSPDGSVWSGAPTVFPPPHADVDALTCVVIKADPDDDLLRFDARYETTRTPCEVLWGPGTWPQAQEWLSAQKLERDEVDALDRCFLTRFHGTRLHLPQRPEVVAGLPAGERIGEWLLFRADHPLDVFNHARQLLAGGFDCTDSGPCPRCAVQTLYCGDWSNALLQAAAATGNVVAPAVVPDARATSSSGWPRWIEIIPSATPGERGSWSVPA